MLLVPARSRAQGHFFRSESVIAGYRRRDKNQQPSQVAPTVVFSFTFADSGNDFSPYRVGFVWEAEVGSTSDVESCQTSSGRYAGCWRCGNAGGAEGSRLSEGSAPVDALRQSNARIALERVRKRTIGRSGCQHFTLQGGRDFDLRRAGSIHGVRLSVDYRRVFSTNANRNRLRFVTSYLLGPPEPQPPAGSPAPGREKETTGMTQAATCCVR